MSPKGTATVEFPPIARIDALRLGAEPEFEYQVVPQPRQHFTQSQIEELKRLLKAELGSNSKITTSMTRQAITIKSKPADKFDIRSKYPTLTTLIKLLRPEAKYVAFGLLHPPAINAPGSQYTWIVVGILGDYTDYVLALLKKKIKRARFVKKSHDVKGDPSATAVALLGSSEGVRATLTTELLRDGISLTVYSFV